MDYRNPDALVSTEWLAKHLEAPDVRIVDATYYLTPDQGNAAEDFIHDHIPGAVFFDIDSVCDKGSDLPHMLPDPETFEAAARNLGLGDGNRIIVYDRFGGFCAAARAWWTFRVYGHSDVAVLNGGLPRWMREGHPLEEGEHNPRPRPFIAHMDHTLVRDYDQVAAVVGNGREQIVDARSAGRFIGAEPEPRHVKNRGHIPGSANLPFPELLQPKNDYALRPAEELVAAFETVGIDPTKPIVATCGSGVTASVVALALYLLGHDDAAVYDGSWAEWGNRDGAPVEV